MRTASLTLDVVASSVAVTLVILYVCIGGFFVARASRRMSMILLGCAGVLILTGTLFGLLAAMVCFLLAGVTGVLSLGGE